MAKLSQNLKIKNSGVKNIAVKKQASSDPLMEDEALDCGCAIKARIIEVATERFRHYGYNKTTISDIATDCQMSAGNIYRYFDSKLDIATFITQNLMQNVLTKSQRKIQQVERAQDRLRALLLENLRITYKILEKDPKFINLILAVRKERPAFRRWLRKMERSHIEQILIHGKKTGEFRLDCITSTARIIQCFITRFRWSQLSAPHTKLKRLETELEGVVALMATALSAGCIVGDIMKKHPKIKRHHQPLAYPIPLPQGAVF